MGTETEYGITGGHAGAVVSAYKADKKSHKNREKTNESVVEGMHDIGGHVGGDYGTLEEQMADAEVEAADPEDDMEEYYGGFGMSPLAARAEANLQRRKGRFSGIRSAGRRVVSAVSHITPSFHFDPDDILANGARFYIDMGHPEYSTGEASNPIDFVTVDKAGERIVDRAAKLAGEDVKIYKNNSDGNGNSYGCHENYLMERVTSNDFETKVAKALMPFFVTRQIFTGSGKIGIERESRSYSMSPYSPRCVTSPFDTDYHNVVSALDELSVHFLDMPEFRDVEKALQRMRNKREKAGPQQIYQLSQRADFFQALIGLQTTQNRPIVNTRDEPHANQAKYMRLHVICGDANMCEYADFLKAGTTSLVLDLIEDGLVPDVKVPRPIKAVKDISRDQSRKWKIQLSPRKHTTAVEVQRSYLDAAQAYRGRDTITDFVLDEWQSTLDSLERDPMELTGKVDWVTKLYLLNHLMEQNEAALTDEVITNAALQYHDVDKEKSLFYFLESKGITQRITTDEAIEHAINTPPNDTRAFLRGKATGLDFVSSVDWGGFDIDGSCDYKVKLNEPFAGTEEQYAALDTSDADRFAKGLKRIKGVKVTKKRKFMEVPKWQDKNKNSTRFPNRQTELEQVPTQDTKVPENSQE